MSQNYSVPKSILNGLRLIFASVVVGFSLILFMTKDNNEMQLQPALYYRNETYSAYDPSVSIDLPWAFRFPGINAINPINNKSYTLFPRSEKYSWFVDDIYPSPNGRLVFITTYDGQFLLETNTLRVIAQIESQAQFVGGSIVGDPWSPNGQNIVYLDNPSTDDEKKAGIWVMNKDGGDKKQIVQTGGSYLPTFLGWHNNDHLLIRGTSNDPLGTYTVSLDDLDWEFYSEFKTDFSLAPDNLHYVKVNPWEPSAMLFKDSSDEKGINILPTAEELPDGWKISVVQHPEWSLDSKWIILEISVRAPEEELSWGHSIVFLISSDNNNRLNLNQEIYPNYPFEQTSLSVKGWSPDNSLIAAQGTVQVGGCESWTCSDSIYVYSLKDRISYSVPVPVRGVMGWWPMIKKGPLGLPVNTTLFLVENRNGLIIGMIISLFALLGLVLISNRSNDTDAKDNGRQK